jgi:LPXTG-motif cell wall-anchored protein
MVEGFSKNALKAPITQLSQLEPVNFFTHPNLWLGLAFAALALALAWRRRRYGEPT